MRTPLALASIALLPTACQNYLPIPPAAQIKCQSNNDCASGFVCIATIGQCAAAESVDHTPPTLVGTATPRPLSGGTGP